MTTLIDSDENGLEAAPVQETQSTPEPKDELIEWASAKGFDANTDKKFLQAYRNLEQDHGRLRNEVGESRQLIDRVLKLEESRQPKVEEERFEIDPTDLLATPVETLDKYFSRKEQSLRQQYDARIAMLEGQLGQRSLEAKHADAAQIVNDPDFVQFVQASPVRMRVAAAALQNQDLSALDDLLTEYKAVKPGSATPQAPRKDNLSAVRSQSLESNRASSGGNQKVLRRIDIIRKKIEDPEGYEDPAYQAELIAAYQEGRVK